MLYSKNVMKFEEGTIGRSLCLTRVSESMPQRGGKGCQLTFGSKMKTRTKVVHKNVSQGCNLIKRLKFFLKIAQPPHNIKVAL